MEEKQPWVLRLKEKWGLKSNTQVVIVLVVFSITGSLAVFIRKPILDYFEISPERMNSFLYWFLRIGLIFPIYQVMLLVVGAVFGQFTFFWNFQKKFLGRLMGR